MLSVLVADDQIDFLDDLSDYFKYSKLIEPGFNVVACCSDGSEALNDLKAKQPDLAILDIDMPKLNGLEVALYSQKFSPKTKTVLYSCYSDFCSFQELADACVKGYLVKPMSLSKLDQALVQIIAGKTWFDPLMVNKTYQSLLDKTRPVVDLMLFTPLERRLLKMMQAGQKSAEMSAELKMNPNTLKTHLQTICKKAGCEGMAELRVQLHRFV